MDSKTNQKRLDLEFEEKTVQLEQMTEKFRNVVEQLEEECFALRNENERLVSVR